MTIELFTLLEKQKAPLVDALLAEIDRAAPAWQGLSDAALRDLAEQLHELFVDLIIVGEDHVSDTKFAPLAAVVVACGPAGSDVLMLPALLGTVVRRQMQQVHLSAEGQRDGDAVAAALDQTERVAHLMQCALVDALQDRLKTAVQPQAAVDDPWRLLREADAADSPSGN